MHAARMLMAVDLYAAGEPGRVILGGMPDVPGNSMFEKKRISSSTWTGSGS
jgi:proline racemase